MYLLETAVTVQSHLLQLLRDWGRYMTAEGIPPQGGCGDIPVRKISSSKWDSSIVRPSQHVFMSPFFHLGAPPKLP